MIHERWACENVERVQTIYIYIVLNDYIAEFKKENNSFYTWNDKFYMKITDNSKPNHQTRRNQTKWRKTKLKMWKVILRTKPFLGRNRKWLEICTRNPTVDFSLNLWFGLIWFVLVWFGSLQAWFRNNVSKWGKVTGQVKFDNYPEHILAALRLVYVILMSKHEMCAQWASHWCHVKVRNTWYEDITIHSDES